MSDLEDLALYTNSSVKDMFEDPIIEIPDELLSDDVDREEYGYES